MILSVLAAAYVPAAFGADPVRVAPGRMPAVTTVDERYQSFNIEMVEVTGGRFWAPYSRAGSQPKPVAPAGSGGPALDAAAFRMRPPLDLANPRLRKLASALGPTYLRVSGTWANSSYFHDSDGPAPASPPSGFGGVLTRRQWRGVIDFARAVNASLVTSFAVSEGVRDGKGVWTPDQARKLLSFTRSAGGNIAAAEFFNEPSFATLGGAPKGYDAAAYARDFAVFRSFARKEAPGMWILAPGSLGEASPTSGGMRPQLKSEDILAAIGSVDAVSYHFYGAASKRCAYLGEEGQTSAEAALSEDWLSRTERDESFYASLRDRFDRGKPLWLTETAESGCGGNPWASSFLDSFRYLDQLGRLAKRGVQVVAHNTLDASDYALIDEATLTPRPDYWAALLWRKLMGMKVLDAGAAQGGSLRLYAHCLRGTPGGVALLAINTDREAARGLEVPAESERYTLTAKDLLEQAVRLNGKELGLDARGELPALAGIASPAGEVPLPPASITFLAIKRADNLACR